MTNVPLPATFVYRIADLIRGLGETITYLPEAGAPVELRASVQSPIVEQIIQDADQDMFDVYISALDQPVAPTKFERIILRGVERAITSCRGLEANGQKLVWWLKVEG